ncbi:hypothetical protein E6O75_ATG03483 [Venturia nashicola]|uniref:Uncharacterized protein n=1 Tax=Venturia nashicola TaxID=86259 RepID=A0A4Z1PP02_9PEZI|nr:hypothetical protein E6O75_ATG03483 [Venturia nashicola]
MMAEMRLRLVSVETPMSTVIWTKVSGIISSVRVAVGNVDTGATGATGDAVGVAGAGAAVEDAVAPSAEQEIEVI